MSELENDTVVVVNDDTVNQDIKTDVTDVTIVELVNDPLYTSTVKEVKRLGANQKTEATVGSTNQTATMEKMEHKKENHTEVISNTKRSYFVSFSSFIGLRGK